MVHLLDFPTELLKGIASYVPPDDFYHLLGTCKHLYDIKKPDLGVHKHWQQRMNTISTEVWPHEYEIFSHDACNFHSIIGLLSKVLQDPWKARLV